MVPEMEMVREVTKLKGDFGRNKESKWLTDFNKLEDEAKRKKRYAAAAPYPFMDVGASGGYTPIHNCSTCSKIEASMKVQGSCNTIIHVDFLIIYLYSLMVTIICTLLAILLLLA